MSAARTAAEWGEFLARHMPPGEALDLEPGSLFRIKFDALGVELARFDALVEQLGDELDPRYATELLSDWERAYDLPRECQEPPTTIALRRAVLVSLLTRGADLSPATLIEAAAIHGYTISIKEYFPESVPGDLPLSNRFKYDVTVDAELEIVWFTAGISAAGDPLGRLEQTDLECLLSEIEPAYAERSIVP